MFLDFGVEMGVLQISFINISRNAAKKAKGKNAKTFNVFFLASFAILSVKVIW
jgi:hypothetical protein